MIRRAGFTLIETLACLLVLSMGFAAAIVLVAYGLQLARMSQARTVGMATAITVAVDPSPLLPGGTTLTSTGTMTTGWINGLWVERNEDAGDLLTTGLRSHLVRVEVYESGAGRRICSYQERLLRQAP